MNHFLGTRLLKVGQYAGNIVRVSRHKYGDWDDFR
jgi:hypothetical protein